MVPLLLAIPFGPMMAWKRGDMFGVGQRLFAAIAVALAAALAVIYFTTGAPVLAALGIGLAVYILAGSVIDLGEKSGVGRVPFATAFARFAGLPRSVFGTFLGHFGIGLTTLGIVVVSTFGTESVTTMRPGDLQSVAGYAVRFESLKPFAGPNYSEEQGAFAVLDVAGNTLDTIVSAKHLYPARRTPTTEAGISTRHLSQVYISLGDKNADGSIVVRFWWKPLITLIWFGAIFMVVGAIASLSDRRLRVGAPKPSAKRLPQVANV
jgi:cytochrome c-type biogenesis protein CcmF